VKEKEQIRKEAEMVKADLEELKKDLLMWESLKENDDKILFCIGLPNFLILKMVFELAYHTCLYIRPHGNRKLDNFAYHFGMCESVISSTIQQILYVSLKFLI